MKSAEGFTESLMILLMIVGWFSGLSTGGKFVEHFMRRRWKGKEEEMNEVG